MNPAQLSDNDLKLLLSLVDLTSLSGNETEAGIAALCEFGKSPGGSGQVPAVAGICTFPDFIAVVRRCLSGSNVRVVSVTRSFPHASPSLNALKEEVMFAVDQGADEVDIVMNRTLFLQGGSAAAAAEINAAKEVCGDRLLKVILETSQLGSISLVRSAAELALNAGADFVKSSTGKIGVASHDHILEMASAVRSHFERTGRRAGIKPSGGISLPSQAAECLNAVKSVLGEDWLNARLFRFGASSLARSIAESLNGKSDRLQGS